MRDVLKDIGSSIFRFLFWRLLILASFSNPMIKCFCLQQLHTHLFLTYNVRPFLINSACEALLVSFVSFYMQAFLATLYLILLHLLIQILTIGSHSFNPLRYTCECNNCYKLKIS